jgi:hypothetical protein
MSIVSSVPRPAARAARYVVIAATLALGGCLSDPGPSVTTSVAPSTINMAGRWALTAGGGTTCAINLTNITPTEGEVRPEGGCAGNFFTSRKWALESGMVVLRDHNGQPLARLKQLAAGRYEGQSTGGQPVELVR